MELNVSWQQWKKTLSTAVQGAEFVGLGPQKITDLSFLLGNFLAKNVDPGNPEQKLLNDLWSISDEREKRMLAGLLVRLVENSPGKDTPVQ